MSNDICKDLIQGPQTEYEQPGIINMFDNNWKGKADIINHDEKLVIDLKMPVVQLLLLWKLKTVNTAIVSEKWLTTQKILDAKIKNKKDIADWVAQTTDDITDYIDWDI